MELVPNMIMAGGCTEDIANILPWRRPYGSFKTPLTLHALLRSCVRSLALAHFHSPASLRSTTTSHFSSD